MNKVIKYISCFMLLFISCMAFSSCQTVNLSSFEGLYIITTYKETEFTEYWGQKTNTNTTNYLETLGANLKIEVSDHGEIFYYSSNNKTQISYKIEMNTIKFLNTPISEYYLEKKTNSSRNVTLIYNKTTYSSSGASVSKTGKTISIVLTKSN